MLLLLAQVRCFCVFQQFSAYIFVKMEHYYLYLGSVTALARVTYMLQDIHSSFADQFHKYLAILVINIKQL